MLRKLFLFILIFISIKSHAQKHEWLSTAMHSAGTVLASKSNIQTTDAAGNVYIIGNFRGSIFFPADTISFTTPNQFTAYVAKYDAKGNNLWAKLISASNSIVISTVQVNRQQELVFYGNYLNGSVNPIILGNDTLRLTRASFLAFMDTSGQFKSATNIATGGAVATAYRMAFAPNDDIVLTGYHSFGTKSLFDSGTAVNVTLSCCDFYLARFSSSGKTLRWHKSYETTRLSLDQGLDVSADNQIYVGFILGQSQSAFGLSAGTSGSRAGLAWFRGDGTFYKARISGENNLRGFECIVAKDSNFIFLSGTAQRDSFTWVNKKFYKRGTLTSLFSRTFCFAITQNHWDSISWSHTSTYHTSTATNNNIGVMSADMEGEFIFLSFETKISNTDTFQFAGFKIPQNLPGKLVKFDFRGNALWILNTPSDIGVSSVNMAGNGDVVYSGVVSSRATFSFDPFSYTRPTTGFWLYAAKTFDYSIARGNVRSGPYCAGDTILVPFLKFGDYDTTNQFIAELSDEQGNFLGGERELGRIRTNQDSVVIGRLPLFEVASSPKYRIRVRSTHPVVQSFYLLDSLRLLIYSRDKADPGPDTTICRGESIKLNTFGGTTWLWSPNVNMDNPRSRTPNVRPDSATTYTIIIGDSSGCGAPDTASIRVFLRDSLRISETFQSDTSVCLGASVVLKASFEGGKQQGYRAQWYNAGAQLLANRAAPSGRDSFEFKFTKDTSIYLVLTDSCSKLNDTVRFQVRLFQPVRNLQFPESLTLCQGEEVLLRTTLDHERTDSIRFIWTRLSDNEVLSRSDSMSWVGGPFGVSIGVELLNACDNQRYTDRFDLFTRAPWAVEIGRSLNQDSLCFGTEVSLFTLSSGGKAGPGTFLWKINGDEWSTDSMVNLRSDAFYNPNGSEIQTLRIGLNGSDLCSKPDGQDSITLYLRPPLRLERLQEALFTACYGNSYRFNSDFMGGLGTEKSMHNWFFRDSLVSQAISFNFASEDYYAQYGSGPHKLMQVLSDGCSRNDTLFFQVFISPPPILEIPKTADTFSICNGNTLSFGAIVSGGRQDSSILEWQFNNETWMLQDSLTLRFYKGLITTDSVVRIRARFYDPCSPIIVYDSVYVRILNSPLISFSGDSTAYRQKSDTLICLGQDFILEASVFYSKLAANEALWFVNGVSYGNTARLLFDQNVYNLRINDSIGIMALMNDACAEDTDTAFIAVRIRPDLNLLQLTDTTVCFGSSLNLQAQLLGGQSLGYQYTWTDIATNTVLSIAKDLSINNITVEQTLRIEGTDQCSGNKPQQLLRISVLDPLRIALSASDTCFSLETVLTASAQGGNGNYVYQWFENGTDVNAAASQLTVSPQRNATYSVTLTDNCSTPEATANITVSPIPVFDMLAWDSLVCAPYTATFETQANNGEIYVYKLMEGASIIDGQALEAGSYTLELIATNDLGCSFSKELKLRVKPLPDAGFSYTPQDPSFDNPEVIFNATNTNLDTYTWLLNGAEVNNNSDFGFTFQDTGMYSVMLQVELDGCIALREQFLRFRDNYRYYDVGAFSPNRDGINDTYMPTAFGIGPSSYTVYNRWGGIVFQGSTEQSWDGTYQGQDAAAGTYTVLILLIDRQGRRTFINQRLQLIR